MKGRKHTDERKEERRRIRRENVLLTRAPMKWHKKEERLAGVIRCEKSCLRQLCTQMLHVSFYKAPWIKGPDQSFKPLPSKLNDMHLIPVIPNKVVKQRTHKLWFVSGKSMMCSCKLGLSISYFCGGAFFIFITCFPKLSLLSEMELLKPPSLLSQYGVMFELVSILIF